jgi:hypothetical protein
MLRERTMFGIVELIFTAAVSQPVDETAHVWNICSPLTWADSRRPSRDETLLVPVSRSRCEAPALMPGTLSDRRAITKKLRDEAHYTTRAARSKARA